LSQKTYPEGIHIEENMWLQYQWGEGSQHMNTGQGGCPGYKDIADKQQPYQGFHGGQ
jgi:hypothetical protein